MTDTKTCRRCELNLSLLNFYLKDIYCKLCRSLYGKERYLKVKQDPNAYFKLKLKGAEDNKRRYYRNKEKAKQTIS